MKLPIYATATIMLLGCGSVSNPSDQDAGSGDDAGASADASAPVDAAVPLPNVSEALGRPWTSTEPFALNPEWEAACIAELPNAGRVSPPGRPAADDNCAGNPALCGASDSQDCREEPASSDWLHRATIDTLTFPNAVCNDGSPALIEVRRGRGAGANNWLIWFKGGGGCSNQHVCAKRWCGNQSGDKYRASIMSNDWNGDGKIDQNHCSRPDTGSALDPNLVGNPFANANIVRIRYCGSDSHTGDASDVALVDDSDDDSTDLPFSVHFRGHAIAAAVIDMLKTGVTTDDGAVTLPTIDDATRVVISGSSAGSGGALHNMDFLHERLQSTNSDVVVRGVLDVGSVRPSFDVLQSYGVYVDSGRDGMVTPGTDWASYMRDQTTEQFVGIRSASNSFYDQTCVDHYAGQDDQMWKCMGGTTVLTGEANGAPFVSTPIFLRRDLADPTASKEYRDCVDPLTEQSCYDPPHSFLSYDSQTPSAWLTLADSSNHIGATLETIYAGAAVTGVFAPLCLSHTGFTNAAFSRQRVTHYDDTTGMFTGPSYSFMEALNHWLNGNAVKIIDASAEQATARSQCDGDAP